MARWVRRHCPGTTTLVLTAHDWDAFRSTKLTAGLAEVEETGAAGFITKDETPERLVAAIRRVARDWDNVQGIHI